MGKTWTAEGGWRGPSPEEIADQYARLRDHAPSCLTSLVVEVLGPVDHVLDGHGAKVNTFFGLRCSCSTGRLRVAGYWWTYSGHEGRTQRLLLSPLDAVCTSCGTSSGIIDTDRHGHDGDQGFSCTRSGVREASASKGLADCDACGHQVFTLIARFEYPSYAMQEPAALEDSPQHEADRFSWFTLIGTCASCGTRQTITEFECA